MSSLVLSRDEHTAAYLPVQEMQKAIVLAQICLYGATLRFLSWVQGSVEESIHHVDWDAEDSLKGRCAG